MKHRHRLTSKAGLAVTLQVLFALALAAQDAPCLRRSFVVTVTDKNGNPVTGLSAANFRGEFRGRPVKIVAVEPDLSRRRTIVLLDQSGSMTSSEQGWSFIKDLAGEVVMNAAERSMVALMTFSTRPEALAGFETPTDEIIERVRKLPSDLKENSKPNRKTALWDTILAAQGLLQTPRAGDLICVVTDGGENASKVRFREIESSLLRKGTRLLVITVPSWMIGPEPRRHSRLPEEDAAANDLASLAIRAGGDAISLEHWGLSSEEDIRGVANAIRTLFRKLSSCYQIEVQFHKSEPEPEPWKLEVLDGGSKMKNVELSYPRKLMPCSEPK